jgi:hypothetical protein
MGGTYSIGGREEKFTQVLVSEPARKETTL